MTLKDEANPMERQFEIDMDSLMSRDPALIPVDSTPSRAPMLGSESCVAKEDGMDYIVRTPWNEVRLIRDTDFALIPGVKSPTLLKGGSEKIVMAYGLLQHYSIESKYEDLDSETPAAYYMVKCELIKIQPETGKEYVFTTGYGSANTLEKRNGKYRFEKTAVWDNMNSAVKMAQKRAMAAAALSISGLSGLFTQDMENEDFIQKGVESLKATNDPDAPITRNQMKLIYALASNKGLTSTQAKQAMVDAGFPSVKALTQKDFDKVRALFAEGSNG